MDITYRTKSVKKGSAVDNMNYSFTVTQNCNLACKYCYESHKNSYSRMSLETALKAVDFALNYPCNTSSVTFEFMGGEPLLEIETIDEVCDYIKFKLYEEKHRWFGNCNFEVTTNGVLYNTEPVQRFIKKNKNCLAVSMTVDGIKEKHDMNRVFKDGTGSFDSIIKNVPIWLEQFPNAGTKVTFTSNDLKYLKDSIIFINSLGVQEIIATLVYEDVWKDGDDLVFENQLMELADYMIENNKDVTFSGGFFGESVGLPYNKNRLKLNWCNCGQNSFEIDSKGYLYPCVRFLPFTLNKESRAVGDIYTGVDYNKLRPFEALNFLNQSKEECLSCPVANGCGWCVGNNYSASHSNTIFERATAICKMHKARCRANDYYYAKLKNKYDVVRRVPNLDRKRFIYFLISNSSVDYCIGNNRNSEDKTLSFDNFKKGLKFARDNFYTPVIVYDNNELHSQYEKELKNYEVKKIKPASLIQSASSNDILAIDVSEVQNIRDKKLRQIILHIKKSDILNLSKVCKTLFSKVIRTNLIIDDWQQMNADDLNNYKEELTKIANQIYDNYKKGIISQFDVLTDIMTTQEKVNCGAGYSSFILAPDGKFYPCPSFYYSDNSEAIGNLKDGIFNYSVGFLIQKSPLCSRCDKLHCKTCVYDNIMQTGEYTVPSAEQCKIRHIEKLISIKLQRKLISIDENTIFKRNILKETDYIDILDVLVNEKFAQYR